MPVKKAILIKALNRRTIDDYVAIAKRRTLGAGEDSRPELMSKSGTPHAAEPVPFRNCICSPFVKLRIPTWAVIICDRRNAAESVIWSVPAKNPFSERFHVLFCKQLVV